MTVRSIKAARQALAAAAAVLTLQGIVLVTPAAAQYSNQSPRSQDAAIRRAFDDVLHREPTSSEMRRYRNLMTEEHWGEADVRDDLRSRGDYRSYASSDRSVDPDRVIRRAYEDILQREPDAEGLRHYRTQMTDKGWTEQDVRQALRKSEEHAGIDQASADRIVRRAYQDILGREPDFNGLAEYRNQVLHHGWDEHDVREALKRSPEYRQKNTITRDKAVEIVNRAYRSVLGRDADPGAEGYIQRVLRDHWSEADVARELRHSDEYRKKQQ
jgi:TorA maturation chaperone TorD